MKIYKMVKISIFPCKAVSQIIEIGLKIDFELRLLFKLMMIKCWIFKFKLFKLWIFLLWSYLLFWRERWKSWFFLIRFFKSCSWCTLIWGCCFFNIFYWGCWVVEKYSVWHRNIFNQIIFNLFLRWKLLLLIQKNDLIRRIFQ